MKQEVVDLKAKLEVAQFALTNEEARRRDLEYRIAQLLGDKFMPSSEKVSIEQLELTLDGLSEARSKPELTETPEKKKHYQSRKTEFPDDLPTEELKVDVPEAELTCPDTGKPRQLIRLEESIKYERVPGRLKKIIILREVRAAKYTDSDPIPSEPVVTAEMPPEFQVIPGCYAGVKLLVQVLVSKYCDHLPLYRQQEIFEKRHRVKIDRTLMGHWMKRLVDSNLLIQGKI